NLSSHLVRCRSANTASSILSVSISIAIVLDGEACSVECTDKRIQLRRPVYVNKHVQSLGRHHVIADQQTLTIECEPRPVSQGVHFAGLHCPNDVLVNLVGLPTCLQRSNFLVGPNVCLAPLER